jgi:hypothetical protein
MESPMHRWQNIVPDLQAASLADPGQGALHDPADLAQAAAVRRPLLRQAAQGYREEKRLKEDKALDPLRPRPDFQELLAGTAVKPEE